MRTARGRHNGTDAGDVATDAVKGAVAGAIGVWAMDKVVGAMWDRTSPENRQREHDARPRGLDPAHVIANEAAEAMGMELTPRQPHPAGVAVHYAIGVGPGAAYGALRHHFPAITAGAGALMGIGLFLLHDEALNPIMGTSGLPSAYPMEAHGRGLLGHLVFGLATHASLEMLDRVV